MKYTRYIALLWILALPGCRTSHPPPNPPQAEEAPIPDDVYGAVVAPDRPFKVGIVMTAFDRPEFLRTSLLSLAASELDKDVVVVIVDDHSQSRDAVAMIKEFALAKATLIKVRLPENKGLIEALLAGTNLIKDHVQYITNLDPDTYLKKGWVPEMVKTFKAIQKREKHDRFLLTGFNTLKHPVIGCEDETDYKKVQTQCCTRFQPKTYYCPKKDVGGINFFYSKSFFVSHIEAQLGRSKPNWRLWDWDLVHHFQEHQLKMFATSPSLIQHLGSVGTNSVLSKAIDFADDF